jgi:kinetochore protein Spc25
MSLILSRSFIGTGEGTALQFDPNVLFSEIDAFSTKFDKWCEKQMREHMQIKSQYIAAEERNRVTVQQLLATKATFESQTKSLDQEIQKQESLISDLTKSLERLKLEETMLTPQLQSVQTERDFRQRQLNEEKERFNKKALQKQLRRIELSTGVDTYRRRLGLEFRRNSSTIQAIFTQILRDDPHREFSFTFKVLADNTYELIECQPHLRGLRPLWEEVNQTQDFKKLVFSMRQRFQEHASQK